MENVTLSVYGDDNFCTIHPDVQSWFHFNAFKAEALKFGIKVTDAAKTGCAVPDLVPLDKLEFLKRNFRKEGHYIMAPLQLDSIRKTLTWSKSKPPYKYTGTWMISKDHFVMQQTLKSVFQELALHGEEVYNTWTEMIRSSARGSPLQFYIPERGEALAGTDYCV